MKCAVIKIVISLIIISGVCLVTGDIGNQLAIADGLSTKIQSCVRNVIEHILNPTESLVFVISSHPDYIPSQLPNPVTVVDMRFPMLPTHYKRYEVNYVIEAESRALLGQALNTITRSSLWHEKESPKGKFVILIKEEEALQTIFFRMWRYVWALHIIVVIYEDTSNNCPMKVIMSNPQAEGNNCGRTKPTVFSNFSCDNISLEFLKPIRNYNGCPVVIQPHSKIFEFNLNTKGERTMYNLVASLNRTLNVTPIFLFGDSSKRVSEYYRNGVIFIMERYFNQFSDCENSIIFLRKLFLWTGPPPIQISPFKTVFLPFKYDLWIAVLFITVLMILLKWMIMKGNGHSNNYVNLACAFTDIIGLTFGVCVNRIPNIWSLKLLLAFFLIYMIHIHTAYTSDLMKILNTPRYEGLISNVEEVADYGRPIIIHDSLLRTYFENGTIGGAISEKIKKLMIPMSTKAFNSIGEMDGFKISDEDGGILMDSETRLNSRVLRKTSANVFVTNELLGEIKYVFLLQNGSYFAESLNALITHLCESGTEEADWNLNPSPFNVKMKESQFLTGFGFEVLKRTYIKDASIRPLRLKDVLPIFFILLICYTFCIIIFVAEIFVHKIVAHITRNQVVPLNV